MRSFLAFLCLSVAIGAPGGRASSADAERQMLQRLDAPLLFVKRHSYTGIHIYDTFYKWPPGGGGIYVLENPAAPRAEWKIRPVIDPSTPGTLGMGVYTHPELSWDAKKLLFCFKGEPDGSTSIYEIGVDGTGLRRISDPSVACACYKGSQGGQHDIAPAYLPDGRIVLLSTRPSGLVPCANKGVSILHVMNADGSDLHPISVNNVNEFDPSILPDGRILFGRWEYVDKNALTIQSLWTVNPDGTNETALYANNMVFPEAILDARPVSGSHLIVGTLAKHNSTPRGSIGLIDPRLGKNNPAAIVNLEHPDDPTFDKGDSCEPWPLGEDLVVFSGRAQGQKRNAIEMLDRGGHRLTLLADPDICLHSPMLIKTRPVPTAVAEVVDRTARTGRFFLQDVYNGLRGVKRGEVKWLRVIEETSRVSATPGGKQPYNQTFLVSAALAFSAKNFLGVVPVEPDGSAFFEAPSGRAVYFQALDAEGRLIHSMRTFVQAAPGATRSCIGCHEYKYGATPPANRNPGPLHRAPRRLQPESWGSGYVDFPGMVQPILDRHCVSCHGGEKGFAGRMDLSGGWTEHFNIGYENLVNRRETQLVAYWIAGIDCMNGTAYHSSPLFPPRSHGSGAAPLADILVQGHDGQIPNLSRRERDLLMAWIDSNGLYHGSWDYSKHGCAIREWENVQRELRQQMQAAKCTACHGVIESDWINLQTPALSRVLRAPLAKGPEGFGQAMCRNRKVDPAQQRVRLLWKGYAHAVQTLDKFERRPLQPHDNGGEPVVSFASVHDPHYQAMLGIVQRGRLKALAEPRVDMPGAEVLSGACRHFTPPPLPDAPLPLAAAPGDDGAVQLAWECSARTIGLEFEIHRGDRPDFTPTPATRISLTTAGRLLDLAAAPGKNHYALVVASGARRGAPVYASVDVPDLPPPAAPSQPQVRSLPGEIVVAWMPAGNGLRSYDVYRAQGGAQAFMKLTPQPQTTWSYSDTKVDAGRPYWYRVVALDRRGRASPPSPAVEAVPKQRVREPVFSLLLDPRPEARLLDGSVEPGKLHGGAKIADRTLTFGQQGFLSFEHRPEFDLGPAFSFECRVRIEQEAQMPVIAACGAFNHTGWFLQRIGRGWRWHLGGVSCDGGSGVVGQWVHLVGTFDGRQACLYQNGRLIGKLDCDPNPAPFGGPLVIGQYSQQGPQYQVHGQIKDVRIYRRALDPAEVAAAK